jgi:uncharacterized membrane protein YgaE (UPF0421/DUF939 family)
VSGRGDLWVDRSRTSMRVRLARFRAKRWQIVQCAIAAAVAWFIAKHMLGHTTPVFAPIAAVASLGTSFGQRLRRVAEVSLGVSLGVLVGDLLVAWLGQGAWQLALIVALAFSVAMLLDAGVIFQNQAAVQSIFVTAMLPGGNGIWTRWTEALVGGAVALVAASVVPAAPLRKPREQAAVVVRKIATLLRAAADVIREADAVHGMAVLADARSSDPLVRELQAAADEGMSVVASSPFRVRHRQQVRAISELVEPLDRALRSTRVLVRQVAVAAYRGQPIPDEYADLARELAEAADLIVEELRANRMAVAVQARLVEIGEASGRVPRSAVLNAEGVLLQLRSVIVDLLQLTGMGQFEATDALPPLL